MLWDLKDGVAVMLVTRESNLFWLVIMYQDILKASSIACFTFEKGKENYSLFLKFILSL